MADALSPAPVRVSPLIKFGRWSLLSLGIVYGIFHQSRLSKKEAAFRIIDDKRKAIRAEKLAAEKKIAAAKELEDLSKIVNSKIA